MTTEHPLSECVDRTIASPVGCRRVIHELARLARDGILQTDPKWETTYSSIQSGLVIAIYRPSWYSCATSAAGCRSACLGLEFGLGLAHRICVDDAVRRRFRAHF